MIYPCFWTTIVILCCINSKITRFLSFILTALLIGLRENVGTDYKSYVFFYKYECDSDYLEIGYTYLNRLISHYNGSVVYVFLIMGLLSSFFIYLSLNKKTINYIPSAILAYTGTFIFLVNGVRQGLAISIFFYCYKYIEEKRIIPYVLFILLAFIFHQSILMVFPLYFILDKKMSPSVYVLSYLISFSLIILDFDQIISPFYNIVSSVDRYSGFLENKDATKGFFSIGVFVSLFNLLLLFVLSLKTKIYEKYPVLFNLFFISMILKNMRISSYIFIRVEVVFSWFYYLLLPIVLKEIKLNITIKQIIVVYYVIIHLLLMINSYYDRNIYPYKIDWSIF